MAAPSTSRPLVPWALFGLRGRVSRGVYWMAYIFLIALNSVLVAQVVGGEHASFHDLAVAVAPVLGLVTLYSNIAVSVKRLHDLDANGLFALALLIPFVNILFTIWVGIPPGTRGPNRYGALVDAPPA